MACITIRGFNDANRPKCIPRHRQLSYGNHIGDGRLVPGIMAISRLRGQVRRLARRPAEADAVAVADDRLARRGRVLHDPERVAVVREPALRQRLW